jgi:hypothetical protein
MGSRLQGIPEVALGDGFLISAWTVADRVVRDSSARIAREKGAGAERRGAAALSRGS